MPSRTRLILALGAAVAALAVVLPAQAAPPRLDGTVGPGSTITLKQKGRAVEALKAGRYHYQCDPHAGLMKGDFKVV